MGWALDQFHAGRGEQLREAGRVHGVTIQDEMGGRSKNAVVRVEQVSKRVPCGRVEDFADPLMHKTRYRDKLIVEFAKEMASILRQ